LPAIFAAINNLDMKKFILPLITLAGITIASCNNEDKKQKTSEPKTQTDSLMTDVMDGHDVGMAKMSKIRAMQKEVRRLLDSVTTLPAKVREASAPYKTKLDSLSADLSYAEMAMDKWMQEFNMDSAVNNIDQRIQYLANEKLKVGKVKEAILRSLEKADSLLKARL